MKSKVERKNKIKVGDRVKCTCCDEVKGKVIQLYENEIVDWNKTPYTGYRIQNDKDVCGGGIVVSEKEKTVKI